MLGMTQELQGEDASVSKWSRVLQWTGSRERIKRSTLPDSLNSGVLTSLHYVTCCNDTHDFLRSFFDPRMAEEFLDDMKFDAELEGFAFAFALQQKFTRR